MRKWKDLKISYKLIILVGFTVFVLNILGAVLMISNKEKALVKAYHDAAFTTTQLQRNMVVEVMKVRLDDPEDLGVSILDNWLGKMSEATHGISWVAWHHKVIKDQRESGSDVMEEPKDEIDKKVIGTGEAVFEMVNLRSDLFPENGFRKGDTVYRATIPVILDGDPDTSVESCHTCHEDGMGQKSGEVIGVISIGLPMSEDIMELGSFKTRATIGALLISLLVASLIFVLVRNLITKPFDKFREVLVDIARGEGDLTSRLEINSKDEIGEVSEVFNQFISKIREIVIQIKDIVLKVATASNEMASFAEDGARVAKKQAATSEEAASAVEEMSATSVEMAQSSLKADQSASSTSQMADKGAEMVSRTTEEMKKIKTAVEEAEMEVGELGKRSQEIGEIIGVIDDIADQTNLLALNAAIEAARAGEHGRGFSVVADEVKKLAEKTQNATGEISNMIRNMQKETGEVINAMKTGNSQVDLGVTIAGETQKAFQGIVELVANVNDLISQIASAAEQQSAASSEIANNVATISDVSKEATSGADNLMDSATKMKKLGEDLNTIVNQFKA